MKKWKLAILFGGMSCEHLVSLQSASAVAAHLDKNRYDIIFIGITQKGGWYRYRGTTDKIANSTWFSKENCTPVILSPCRETGGFMENINGTLVPLAVDMAFPIMHGLWGEDGTMQGTLELAGIPVVGCGTLASALCMDKNKAHKLVEQAGFMVPKSKAFGKYVAFEAIEAAATCIRYPLFVKPVKAGSSFGISRAASPETLAAAVAEAFNYDDEIILEEAIEGFEIGCAVLGNETLITGIPDEIELTGGFFNYSEKYNLLTSKIHIPARIDENKTEQVRLMGAAIYRLLGCKGFARVDMFLKPNGSLVFNEVNTIPGFTAHSRYPAMMQAIGFNFEKLLDKIIETAVIK